MSLENAHELLPCNASSLTTSGKITEPYFYRVSVKSSNMREVTRNTIVMVMPSSYGVEIAALPRYGLVSIGFAPSRDSVHTSVETF